MWRVLVVLCVVVVTGCVPKRGPPKFRRGEIVEVVITGERAQIYSVRNFIPWRYCCRVSGTKEKAIHGVVSQRTVTEVYPLVLFREFELRKVTDQGE